MKKYNILAIETTGKEASVALINEEGKVSEKSSKEEMSHLKNLIPLIDELLLERKLKIGDVTCFAVSEGPGSFTGIRIGVTTARGLAQTLGKKIIGVPTLKSFGESPDLHDESPKENAIICPIFDARRNQVYGAAYVNSDRKLQAILQDGCYDLDEFLLDLTNFLKNCSGKIECFLKFYGDGAIKYNDKLNLWAKENSFKIVIAGDQFINQNAGNIVRLARKMLELGMERDFSEIMPVYLRRAEAETKLEEKLKLHVEGK